jgi:anti-anti-sigma regulatory factor
MLQNPIPPVFPDLAASVRLLASALDHQEPPPGEGQRPALYLDLAEVVAPTAGGLGQLVAVHCRLREMGGRLVLCNVRETAYDVFQAARLTELLDIRLAADAPARPWEAA